MVERRGCCSCGSLTVVARGEPLRVSACHCQACQRRTGSVVGIQARFAEDAVTTSGEPHHYLRVAESGAHLSFYFCPQCAAIVWYRNSALPGLVMVPVGVFADSSFPPPTVAIYSEHQYPWLRLDCAIERLD